MFDPIRWARPALPARLPSALVLSLLLVSLGALRAFAAGDPQVAALEDLQHSSGTPVRMDFHGGVARGAWFDVPVRGETPIGQARDFLARYGDLFLRDAAPNDFGVPELLPAVQLPVRRVERTDDGVAVAFRQEIGGVPVFGAGLVVGLRTGKEAAVSATFASGNLLPAVQHGLDLVPGLPGAKAAAAAVESLGRKGEDVRGEPRLQVFSERLFRESGAARLVWAVGVAGDPAMEVLVDAHTGEVAFSHPLDQSDNGLDSYELDLEDANGGDIADTNCFNPTTMDDWIGDETGLLPEVQSDQHAVDTWWNVRGTYAYYHDHLGRHSWDGDGDEITAYVHIGIDNATYRHGCGVQFGDDFVSLDVTAHEFTHGVIAHTSELVYANASGAINESFADLMAAMADPGDWLMGEGTGQGVIRDLSDPQNGQCNNGSCGDPDQFSEWVARPNTEAGDYGGVHSNSGIGNKAGFLIVEGGVFNGVDVGAGIGRARYERLAYHVLRFLPSTATYADLAALYVSTANAWGVAGTNAFTPAQSCVVRNALAAVELRDTDVDCDYYDDSVDDSDQDGIFHADDNCPNDKNPAQEDWDGDGKGDACDEDVDGDACADAIDLCPGFDDGPCYGSWPVDSDGDGIGQACDLDDDNDGVLDVWDNCAHDPNPGQEDGDGNGEGDACDPDHDGDGVYTGDNCLFVANADQADADADGVGDACDNCPNAANPATGYSSWCDEMTGHCYSKPLQGDVDGDGLGNGCDGTLYGVDLGIDGLPFDPEILIADGSWHALDVGGEPGDFRLPLSVCTGDDADALDVGERIELATLGLAADAAVELWIADELERPVATLSGLVDGELRGLHFTPDCRRGYWLHGRLGAPAKERFQLRLAVTRDVDGNPWRTPAAEELVTPAAPADQDGDGTPDHADNCPAQANPTQADADGDGTGDACEGAAPPPACGLGGDVAALLPIWWAWRGRRRARSAA